MMKHVSRALIKGSTPALVQTLKRGVALGDVATVLFGEPNKRLSTRDEQRHGRKGSLVIYARNNRFVDFEAGVSGDAIDLVIHAGAAASFLDAIAWLSDRVGHFEPTRTPIGLNHPSERRNSLLNEIWTQARAVTPGCLVARYLERRAITASVPPSLRFSPALWNSSERRFMPAMIAAVSRPEEPQRLVAIQRTWLAEPGDKAQIAAPRQALGAVARGFVLLGQASDEVCVAEGVESALSASATLGLPSLATLGAGNMQRLRLPASMRRVVIAGDNDIPGLTAAAELLARLRREGRDASIVSAAPFQDFNDMAREMRT